MKEDDHCRRKDSSCNPPWAAEAVTQKTLLTCNKLLGKRNLTVGHEGYID